MQRSVTESCRICGIEETELRQAASYIGNAKGFISMWAMGLNQSVVGVNKNLSLINIHLITGHIGKAGSGPFSLTGQPNAMGGREVGGMSNLLPAHRNLADPADRDFGTKILGRNFHFTQAGIYGHRNVRSIKRWPVESHLDPVYKSPDQSARFTAGGRGAKRKAKFVVMQEVSSTSECLQYADIILPAAGWAEKEGTMTNSERRISHLNKIAEAPGEALPDAEILCRFANKMGFEKEFTYPSMADIFDEHAELRRETHCDISGLNYAIFKERDRTMALSSREQEGVKRFEIAFLRNQKGDYPFVPDTNQSPKANETFPLI